MLLYLRKTWLVALVTVELAMAAFDYTRPAVACAAVGVAQAAMDYAYQYAQEV